MKKDIGKILYLHRTQGIGVEAVHIFGIANAFRSFGYEVDVFSPDGLKKVQLINDGFSSEVKEDGSGRLSYVSKYTPEFIFEILEISYNVIALFKLWWFGVSKYDLIFERYAIFSIVGMVISKIRGIPFILEVNYTSKSPLVRKRSRFLQSLAFIVDKAVFNSATLLTPVSSTLKNELINQFGVADNKIVVLPNAADPTKFKPRKKSDSDGEKVIGFVGGFYPWHGLGLLIDAFKDIHLKVPDAKLMLVGDGPELNHCKYKVEAEGINDKVIFTGRINHALLPDFMSHFYIGVMPNSNEYGSPMKIFEYMALAIPVVAPDYPPILDVLESGRQGIVFKRLSRRLLSEALEQLLSDPDLVKCMARDARASVENEYNWTSNVKKILCTLSEKERFCA